jgi:hypothetical protein
LEEVLLGGEVAECPVRADGVVDIFPLSEFAIEFFHFERAGPDPVIAFNKGFPV